MSHIVGDVDELISEQRHTDHWNAVVNCLLGAHEAAMGDECLCVLVLCKNKRLIIRLSLRNPLVNFLEVQQQTKKPTAIQMYAICCRSSFIRTRIPCSYLFGLVTYKARFKVDQGSISKTYVSQLLNFVKNKSYEKQFGWPHFKVCLHFDNFLISLIKK